ncbi:type II secretion system F family protein [Pirellulales bacterium]|nr:type II secretion system F family protein [Pirellulales bacterium]
MSRRKRYSTAAVANARSTGAAAHPRLEKFDLWATLTKPRTAPARIKPHETTFILQHLATLVGNGVPLPRAIGTLAKEESLSRHRDLLDSLRRKVEGGVAFSAALSSFPDLCDPITLSQIRVGERSGTLVETLKHLAASQNRMRELKRDIGKKLAYPVLLTTLGSCLVAFLLLYVMPVFQETYNDAGIKLPMITRALIAFGQGARAYLPWLIGTLLLSAVLMKHLRKRDHLAAEMDRRLLSLPVFGKWIRDIAVLQVMDVLSNLMNSGFTLADALTQTADSVTNRAVKRGVRQLQRAVQRGERFSHELENQDQLFPPIVNQLVIVGESTGRLAEATLEICDHLRREVERKTTILVGALEPILTISLAIVIAAILLAIYLPMFDMVKTVG